LRAADHGGGVYVDQDTVEPRMPRELSLHGSQRVHKPVDYLDPCSSDVIWSRAGSHAQCSATGSHPRLSSSAWPHHCLACSRRERGPAHQYVLNKLYRDCCPLQALQPMTLTGGGAGARGSLRVEAASRDRHGSRIVTWTESTPQWVRAVEPCVCEGASRGWEELTLEVALLVQMPRT
jgi:hypothetical protein